MKVKKKPEATVLHCVSHLCDKMPNNSNLRREEFTPVCDFSQLLQGRNAWTRGRVQDRTRSLYNWERPNHRELMPTKATYLLKAPQPSKRHLRLRIQSMSLEVQTATNPKASIVSLVPHFLNCGSQPYVRITSVNLGDKNVASVKGF